jgi:hypothetical protein
VLAVLVSAKGAPGVTTAALAVTAAVEGPGLVVEMDPSGGDLELLCGRHGVESLSRVAAGLRHGPDPDRVRSEMSRVAGEVPAVLAPLSGQQAEAALVSCGERLGGVLAGMPELVVADGGRWSPGQPSASRIVGAGVVGVVCQANAVSVGHARALVEELGVFGAGQVVVVVVGERPYRLGEVQSVFAVPVIGPLAVDPAGVAALLRDAGGRRYRFTMLARTAGRVLEGLVARIGEVSGVGG